jgi:hypothetical protein
MLLGSHEVGKQMSLEARREHLQRMRLTYRVAPRSEKSKLLDEMERVTQMHRKNLVRLLKGPSLERQKRRQERHKTYRADNQDLLEIICESFDYPCANCWSAISAGWRSSS